MKSVNLVKSLLFASALSTCVTGALAQAPGSATRIQFASYTPRTMYELIYKSRNVWPRQQVWGDLRLPENMAGRVPAVILLHGSSGIGPSIAQWEEAFNEIGVATFVVDSFGPRNIVSTIANQKAVPYAANVVDALQALKLLANHRRIDGSRIGVMGFSRGGTVALQVALEPIRSAVVKSHRHFSFHIAAYAGCNQVYWSPQISSAPILNLVGGADDYTTAAPCEKLAERYQEAGANVHTVSYPDAHHAWDSLVSMRWMPNATSAAACGVVRWDISTWKIYAERSGDFLAPNQLDAFFADCSTRGAHVGRNEVAYQQSRAEVQVFARRVFFNVNR